MNVLIAGGEGQLGRCLQDVFSDTPYQVLALGSQALNIRSLDSVVKIVAEFKPDIIINAAAYTAVDKAETETESAYAVNEQGPANLATVCAKNGIPLIHVSTDYVFDGSATKPYSPDVITNPQGVYGVSKLAGEKAIIALLPEHVILRTAWVFSEYGNNFVKTMLRLAKSRPELSVVADQYGCPTYAGDIAKTILTITEQIDQGKSAWGIYHYCGDQTTSWHGFAVAIIDEAVQQQILTQPVKVNAIKTSDYPLPAARPAYSVLDCRLTSETWLVKPSPWRDSLITVLGKIKQEN